jgi:Ca2+-binding EF-hand superfamily protein
MKITLSTCAVGLAALLAGTAFAGDPPKSDSPRGMQADKDGDGRVSRAEATSSGAERSGEWFDKLDKDKDGYISQEEMKQARETRQQMHGDMKEKMDARFKEADANGDGQLSLDEVQAKMPRLADHFTALDKDKNGMLSKDELNQGGQGRHHPPQPQS